MKVQRLFFWLLLLWCPSSPDPYLVLVVPDHFPLGPDEIGVLRKLPILTAPLGICVFLIYVWRTILVVKPRQYEVTLKHMEKKINILKNENREIEKNIATWEEKIREAEKQVKMKREHKFLSAKVLKLKENIKKVEEINENLQDTLQCKRALLQAEREKNSKKVDVAQSELGDQEQRALTSVKEVLKESKKFLEDQCNVLLSQKTAKEAELDVLRKKMDIVVDFSEKRKLTAEEKLEKTLEELKKTKNELAAAEENLKATREEMEKYKQQVGEMQNQLQEAEITFKHKITVQERNALANWIKARAWERRIVQQSKENADMKHRLHMMKGEMLPERPMRQKPMPGRPELQKPPQQASRPVPGMNSNTRPIKDAEKATVHRVAWGLRHFPGSHCGPDPRGPPLPSFLGYGPQSQPAPCWPHGPQQPLPPPPFGFWPDAAAAGAPMKNNGTEQNRDPGMGKVGLDMKGLPHCPRPLHMPYHMGQHLPGFPGYGPSQPPPQWGPGGPHPHLDPPPRGLQSHSEASGAQGDNSGTVPKMVPEKGQNHHFVV